MRSAIPRCAGTIAVVAIACSVMGGCRKNSGGEDADADAAAVAVQAQHPIVGPISAEISADAILAPIAQAALAPRISAPIRAEYVQRGAHVHKGQLLIALEDQDLQGNALDTRGAVSSAQAAYSAATQATIPEDVQKAQLDVAQAKANRELARRTADERKRLLAEGAIAGRDVDSAVTAQVQADAAYDAATKHLQAVEQTTRHSDAQSAQGQLTSARGRLMSAEAQVSYASLRSPIDGLVTDRPLFPGEIATAGTPAITVMDTSSLLAKLHIAQSSAQKLRVDDRAQIAIPGMDQPQPATVSLISPALDPGSTTVEVWLKLANPDGRYKVGTPVHVTLTGATIATAVQVPPSAILPGEGGGATVLVVGSDGTAKRRAVKIGIRTPTEVQILDGVSPSDMVVTEGGYGLDDGTKVKIGGDADADSSAEKTATATGGDNH